MKKRILQIFAIVGISILMFSCSQTQRDSSSMRAEGEPCWVMGRADCHDPDQKEWIYFIGGTTTPFASRGRPSSIAKRSATINAQKQFVEYLGMEMATKVEKAVTAAGTTNEGMETAESLKELTRSFARKSFSGLRPFDSYFVTNAKNSKGIPLWNYYVRMRVTIKAIQTGFKKFLESEAINAQAQKKVDTVKGIQATQKAIKKDSFMNSIGSKNSFLGK